MVIEGLSINELEEQKKERWLEISLEQQMDHYLKQNISKKEAIKQIAKDRNVPKREIYNYFNKD